MAKSPKKKPDSESLKGAKERYKQFLDAHPSVDIFEFGKARNKSIALVRLWDDPSVALLLPSDDAALVSSLENIHLPSRYSALYHKDTRKMEVIWTSYKLSETQEEIKGRSFSLTLKGKEYNCHFSKSSDRLVEIGKNFAPMRMTTTNFRNLRSYKEAHEVRGDNISAYTDPVSFWIDNVEWNEDDVLDLIRHINFYLRYYDSHSPAVEIFPAKIDEKINPKNRYIEGEFPSKISSHPLDANLLVFYSASFDSNGASNFLNLYRIIEFVSYSHMHETLRKQVRAVINKPSAQSNVEHSATEIVMLLRETKLEREQETIVRLLKDVLSPERLWNEISQNQAFFSKHTKFEGDCHIEKIISEKSTLETFEPQGVESFARAFTHIRNALAHGKDSKTAKTILPTSRNFELLKPWVHLIAMAAGEVVLYDSTH